MTVEPIRDKNKLKRVEKVLSNNKRNLFLFRLGILTGLRISDLLKLKVKDVKNTNQIVLQETKTDKVKKAPINSYLKQVISDYVKGMNEDDYLFQSRKGDNKPISRIQAYRILKNATKKAGIDVQIGTHTLRKTFGYHHYQQYKDIALLQSILNHSSPKITLDYIGINDDLIKQSIDNFNPLE